MIDFVAVDRDLIRAVAVGRAGDLEFLQLLAADFYVDGAEVFVGVAQLADVQAHGAQRFDRGAGVGQQVGAAAGLIVAIQRATDGEVAGTEDQRLLAVVDTLAADVQPLTGGDDRRRACFVEVGQGAAGDGQTVAVNAPGAKVEQLIGLQAHLLTVDQAAVVQLAVDPQVDLGGGHFAAGGVVQRLAAHDQRLPGEQFAAVVQGPADIDIDLAVGLHLAAEAEVALLAQDQVTEAEQAATAAEVRRIERQQAAAEQGATAVVDGQAVLRRVAIGQAQFAASRDQAGVVVQRLGQAEVDAGVSAQGALLVFQSVRAQQQRLAFDALLVALAGAVVELRGGQSGLPSAAQQAAAIVDALVLLNDQRTFGLHLAALVVEAVTEQLHLAFAGDLALIVEGGGCQQQVALGADKALLVIQLRAAQFDFGLADDASVSA
ncbi:hypothetical protein PS631_02824 [Pseudomonas fluorescens]|uniref:Uncharacterized protein n=1 Tax=Pseudomonas fluorescens TaxID=294 RepID=A0A5E6TEF6_PSEFL|nr:hypothetical protein PS631_02824 [Pseudomonas fluorescens]